MTKEQIALIAHAAEGHVLLTVAGSANDVLWTDMMDRGWMEPADLPNELPTEGLNWRAWKMTQAGCENKHLHNRHPCSLPPKI